MEGGGRCARCSGFRGEIIITERNNRRGKGGRTHIHVYTDIVIIIQTNEIAHVHNVTRTCEEVEGRNRVKQAGVIAKVR